MADDIYIINSVRNNYGPVVASGLNTYVSIPSEIVPEPDSSGLNPTYDNRFLITNGPEYSMDRILANDYFSITATTGAVGELHSLDFDSSGSDTAIFNSMSSSNYGRRPLDILLEWTIETSGTGNVLWAAQIKPYADEVEITGAGYGTIISNAFAVPAVGVTQESRLHMTYEAMMELEKSELYAVKVIRQGTSGEDTYSADARLLSVELIESSSID